MGIASFNENLKDFAGSLRHLPKKIAQLQKLQPKPWLMPLFHCGLNCRPSACPPWWGAEGGQFTLP